MKKLSIIVSALTIFAMALVSCSNPAGGDSNSNGSGSNKGEVLLVTEEITNFTPINFTGRYVLYYDSSAKSFQKELSIKDNTAEYWKAGLNESNEKPIYVYRVPFSSLPNNLKADWRVNDDYFVFSNEEITKFSLTYNSKAENKFIGLKVEGADYFGYSAGNEDVQSINGDVEVYFKFVTTRTGPTEQSKFVKGKCTIDNKTLTPYDLDGNWQGGISKKANGQVTITNSNGIPENITGDYYAYTINKDTLPRDFYNWFDGSSNSFIVFSTTAITAPFSIDYYSSLKQEDKFTLTGANLLGCEIQKSNGTKLVCYKDTDFVEFSTSAN